MKAKFVAMAMVIFLLTTSTSCRNEKDIYKHENIKIRLSHDLMEDTPQHIGALKFKELVEENSGGRIEVLVFPAGQLGSDVETVEMLQANAIQASLVPTAKLSGFAPRLQLIDLPFLFPTREIAYEIFDSPLIEEVFKPLENIGLEGIAVWESGFKQFTANKEIRKSEDFKGLKVRVMESPMLIKQYKSVGANPVPIDLSELYNALQQKVVDGQENPLVSIAKLRFYEVQSHLMLSYHGYLGYAFLFSKKTWDHLTPEDQQIIVQASREAAVLEREETVKREEEFLRLIESSGTKIIKLSDAEKEEWASKMRTVHKQFENAIGKELMEKMYKKIEELQR